MSLFADQRDRKIYRGDVCGAAAARPGRRGCSTPQVATRDNKSRLDPEKGFSSPGQKNPLENKAA